MKNKDSSRFNSGKKVSENSPENLKSDKSSPAQIAARKKDGDGANLSWFEFFSWICAFVAFSPALVWLFKGVSQSGQLADAFIILVSACIVLAVEYGIKPHRPIFSREGAFWLLAAYVSIFSAGIFGNFGAMTILAGLSCAIVSAGLVCFVSTAAVSGVESVERKWVYATGAAFFVFTLLSFVVGAFDLPLRAWAGLLSSSILKFFNDSATLMVSAGMSPQLAIRIDGSSFLVATECNGFGIISSTIVLSVIMVFVRGGVALWKRTAIVAAGAVAAYLANSLRIVCIILLAPIVGEKHYYVMHEALGYFWFAVALFAVWNFSRRAFGNVKK